MLLWIALAVAVGSFLPVQAGINAQLRQGVGSPLLAALVSFVVGTGALALAVAVMRVPLPVAGSAARLSWWHWTGGLLGAIYIAAAIVLAPRLGATLLVALVVAGQLIASLVVDHFGWVGYPVHPISVWRVAGAVLIGVGVYLVQRF